MPQRTTWPALLLTPTVALAAGLFGARAAHAIPAVGLRVDNTLIRFDTSAPGSVSAPVPVTGLQTGEVLLGIDIRPATQQIYAIGNGGSGRIYTLNPATGAATFVATLTADPTDGSSPFTGLAGAEFGMDFNPVPDRIRLVSDADQNLRINPDNGRVITDGTLAFAPGDPNTGENPGVTASAYTNSVAGATSTTLYNIDVANRALVIQNPPNNGTLVTVGSLGVNFTQAGGFDIAPNSNEAFAVLSNNGGPSFILPVNLATGQATPNSTAIAGGVPLRGLALLPLGTVQFSASAYTVNENDGTVSIPVFRTGSMSGSFSVDFTTNPGSATAPTDFTPTSGTLTFAPGQSSATITVPITQSSAAEGDETFTLTLGNLQNSDVINQVQLGARTTATVTITDASAPAASGSNATIFAVTGTNRLVSFAASTPETITSNVPIAGLQLGESILAIDFRPSNGQMYALGSTNRLYIVNTATGVATVASVLTPDPADTSAPFSGLAGTEFGFDFNPAVDRLRITSDADQNLRVNVDTGATITDTTLAFDTDTDAGGADLGDPNAGDNPGVVGSAYTNPDTDPGTGTTLYNIDSSTDDLVIQNPPNVGTLNTVGDLGIDTSNLVGFDIAVGNAAFAALAMPGGLSSLYSVNLSTGEAVFRGQIDVAESIRGIAVALPGVIQLGAATATVAENVASVDVTVTRTGSGAASVNVTVANGTATVGSDFTNPVTARVNFAPGETSRTITIPILNDTEDEADETFTVTLSSPENATLGAIAAETITITDDDSPRNVAVSNVTVNEGSGAVSAVFTVTLSSPSAQTITVNYATADGTAVAPADYASTSGTLTFAPGETSKTVTVTVNSDALSEGTESFFLQITGTTGPLATTQAGSGTINDDDAPALSLSISAPTVAEGASVTGTVTRNTSTAADLVVSLQSSDTSEANVPATVTIPAGQTSATFTITGVQDNSADDAQDVVITASAAGFTSNPINLIVNDSGAQANRAPVANEDFYRTTGRVIRVNAPGVLGNDRDPEGTPLRAVLLRVPMHGRLVFNANGSFTYIPSENYEGSDTFIYAATDGVLRSAPVTVTLRVGRTADTTPPFVSINGGARIFTTGLSAVRGLAADVTVVQGRCSVASSGLASVKVRLQRADGLYFNGRTFQRAAFDFNAALIGRTFFSLPNALPNASLTSEGRYLYTVIATDNAGNRSVAQQQVIVDKTAPAIIITSPRGDANNVARITSLTSVTGRVNGATRVSASIRNAAGQFFNSATGEYQTASFFFTAPVVNGTFSITEGLPTGEDLAPGRYTLDVRAVDEAGNIGAAVRALEVVSAPAG